MFLTDVQEWNFQVKILPILKKIFNGDTGDGAQDPGDAKPVFYH